MDVAIVRASSHMSPYRPHDGMGMRLLDGVRVIGPDAAGNKRYIPAAPHNSTSVGVIAASGIALNGEHCIAHYARHNANMLRLFPATGEIEKHQDGIRW